MKTKSVLALAGMIGGFMWLAAKEPGFRKILTEVISSHLHDRRKHTRRVG